MRRFYYWDEVTQKFTEARPREASPKVHIIQDSMNALAHPCDGRIYDSKSVFRQVTRAHGAVELGNDRITPRQDDSHRTIKNDILRAFEECSRK